MTISPQARVQTIRVIRGAYFDIGHHDTVLLTEPLDADSWLLTVLRRD